MGERGCCTIHDICLQVKDDLDDLHKINKKRKREEEGEKMFYVNRRRSWPNGPDFPYLFDIPNFLSSSSRDYLINNSGDKVPIKDYFTTKLLVLYIWNMASIEDLPHLSNQFFHDLKEIYIEHNPRGQFEVVFVAVGNNEKLFSEAFSVMPWLAIPHEDQESRDLIDRRFPTTKAGSLRSVLFDLDGTIVLDGCKTDFRVYGPEGFPFTKEKITEIERADKPLQNKLLSFGRVPLKELLGEVVISSEGKPVRTSSLKDCTVALHVLQFADLSGPTDPSTKLIFDMWESLKDDPHKKFAIISINCISTPLSYIKETFREKYSDIPWYTLPYDARRLCRVLSIPIYDDKVPRNAGQFIIIKRDKYQPLNYFALDILERYGVGAFPFTLERVVGIEKNIIQGLKLCKLLSPSAPLRRGCFNRHKDCTVSGLLGERVLLLFATKSCYGSGSFLPALKRMYLRNKGTKDKFEIIYISLDCMKSQTSFHRSIKKMPWLVYSFVPEFACHLAEKLFGDYPCLPAIAAFGSDGRLKTKESNLLFKETWSSKFPFVCNMGDEICEEIVDKYNWNLDRIFPD